MAIRTVQIRTRRYYIFSLIAVTLVMLFPATALSDTAAESVGGFNFVEKDGAWVMQLLDEQGKVYHSVSIPVKKELSLDEAESATQPVTVAPKPTPVISKPTIWQSITGFFTGNRPEAAPSSASAPVVPVPPPPPPPAGGGTTDDCQISLSMTASPDFVVLPDDADSRTAPNAKVSGTFNANEKCKAPFTLNLYAGIPAQVSEKLEQAKVAKTFDTNDKSHSFKEDLALSGHFQQYDHRFSVADSCGASSAVMVSSCSIDSTNVSDTALSDAKKRHTCVKPFESSKTSAGSKTQYNPNDPNPNKDIKTHDVLFTSVDFDPGYVKEMSTKNAVTLKKPFAPTDVIEVKLILKVPCPLTIEALRATDFVGTLVTIDEGGKKLTLGSGDFSLFEPYTAGNPVFTMKLLIEPSKDLTATIVAGRPIFIEVDDFTFTQPKSIPISIVIRKKIVAIGGAGAPSVDPLFSWVKRIAPDSSVISGLKGVQKNTEKLRTEITSQLRNGYEVLVVGHSIGSIVAFNLQKEFKEKRVEFLFLDPPYDSSLCRIPGIKSLPFAKAINQAVCDGVATDKNTIDWTRGQGLSHFFTHHPFMFPWYGKNREHLETLEVRIKEWIRK